MELEGLKGRERLKGYDVESVYQISEENRNQVNEDMEKNHTSSLQDDEIAKIKKQMQASKPWKILPVRRFYIRN